MKPTKLQIEKAEEVYAANRKLKWLDAGLCTTENEHFLAIKMVLETVGNPDFMQISKAAYAYKDHRGIGRWDGLHPWGEAGRKNHRAGIKAALHSFSNSPVLTHSEERAES